MTTVNIREELLDRLDRLPANQQLRILDFARSLDSPPRKVASSGKTKSRWARVAEFFESENAGRLNGRSEEAKKCMAGFREGFRLER